MFQFNKRYFLAAMIFFLLLIFIAGYVQDSFIRPHGGDVLVVIFLYCLLKSFLEIPVKNAIFGVLFFAVAIEVSQYFRIVELMGWEHKKIATVILGSYFDWLDILLYCLGALIVYSAEQRRTLLKKGK